MLYLVFSAGQTKLPWNKLRRWRKKRNADRIDVVK